MQSTKIAFNMGSHARHVAECDCNPCLLLDHQLSTKLLKKGCPEASLECATSTHLPQRIDLAWRVSCNFVLHELATGPK